jgi:hypothetical protein
MKFSLRFALLAFVLAACAAPALAQDTPAPQKSGNTLPASCSNTRVTFNLLQTDGANAPGIYRCNGSVFVAVGTSTPGGSSGQIQYNNAGGFAGFTLGGDCTFAAPNVTCTKSGGTAFGSAAFASINSTNGVIPYRSSLSAFSDSPFRVSGGNTTFTGALRGPDGTAGAPTFTFTNGTSTGAFFSGTNGYSISSGGTEVFRAFGAGSGGAWIRYVNTDNGFAVYTSQAAAQANTISGRSGFFGTDRLVTAGFLGLGVTGSDVLGNADVILTRDAANTLAQRNAANAQRHRVYNRWTDASNGEWFAVDWQTTSNVAEVGTKANGTGTVRPMRLLMDTGAVVWRTGSGSPEGVITAGVGSLYTRTDGGAGTTLYVKESGTGNTGWVAK